MDNGKQQQPHYQDQSEEKHNSSLSLYKTSEKLSPSSVAVNKMISKYTGRSELNAMRECEQPSRELYSAEMARRNLLMSPYIPMPHTSINALTYDLSRAQPPSMQADFPIERNANSKAYFPDKAKAIVARNVRFLIAKGYKNPQQQGWQVKRNAENAFEDGRSEAASEEKRNQNISISETNNTTSGDSNDSAQSVEMDDQQAEESSANQQFETQSSFHKDDDYRKKRDKNNAAAKRSRDKKKQLEQQLEIVEDGLYKECIDKKAMYDKLMSELAALQHEYVTIQEGIRTANLELDVKRLNYRCSH